MNKAFLLLLFCCASFLSRAQTTDEWVRQDKTQIKYLGQQIAKLQLYLGYLKKGYMIVNKGLNTISDLKNGDLHLHMDFFDKLKAVNPAVKRYVKIADILSIQKQIVSSYKAYYKEFRQSGMYTKKEMEFIYKLLSSILDKTTQSLTDLIGVVTDGKIVMNDEERFSRIDKLYLTVQENYRFLLSFCQKMKLHYLQRQHELEELQNLQKIY